MTFNQVVSKTVHYLRWGMSDLFSYNIKDWLLNMEKTILWTLITLTWLFFIFDQDKDLNLHIG